MILEYKNENYNILKQVLIKEFQCSNRLITILKRENCIFVNNIISTINTNIKKDDIIKVNLDFSEDENRNILPIQMNLDIIYEDECFLVINKPAYVPIHPSILHFEDTLSNGVKYYFESHHIHKKIRPVNRLDKDTSGLVIFAKNQYIQESLAKQMLSNNFKKEYIAILDGYIDSNIGTISANISRKTDSIVEREINNTGQIAITHYELIKHFEYKKNKLSLVKFTLETGRTHQIRVHCKYINHPILGDTLYGNKSNLISRQALHAYKISFIHPITKKRLDLEATLPIDIEKIIEGK